MKVSEFSEIPGTRAQYRPFILSFLVRGVQTKVEAEARVSHLFTEWLAQRHRTPSEDGLDGIVRAETLIWQGGNRDRPPESVIIGIIESDVHSIFGAGADMDDATVAPLIHQLAGYVCTHLGANRARVNFGGYIYSIRKQG